LDSLAKAFSAPLKKVESKAMTVRPPFRAVLLLAGLTAAAAAQKYVPPPPPLTTLPPCPTDKKLRKKELKENQCDPTNVPAAANTIPTPPPDPTAATQRFPFPGDAPAAPKPAAQAFPFPVDPAPADQPTGTQPGSQQPAGQPVNQPQDSGFSGTYPARPGDPPPASGQKPADTPAANKFPYPGENSSDTSSVPPAPGPGQPAGQQPGQQSGDKYPYPGDSSSSSSSSSGSSSSNSSDPTGSPDPTAAGDTSSDDQPTPPRRRPVKAPKVETDSERVDEDLSVAHYYIQSGNFQGAYLRAQDAVNLQPDYALAHFALAEAAMKLNKDSEAVQEFQTYLKLEPDGKQAKVAEKALAKLN
jgi:hypothetical protein